MLSENVQSKLIALLAPDGYTSREESEACYVPRTLPDNAQVVRMAPSPTGFVHIGTVYTGLINEYLARQSDGVNILRIEDTDKKREVEGSVAQIIDVFNQFDINFDEGPDAYGGDYGPYFQSERGKIYLGFAIELLKAGRAYPCFATAEELEAAVKDQQAQKLRPGYYGAWALWRDKSEEEITAALNANKPFVLRFRSSGTHDKRIDIKDKLKGKLELPQNDLDVPLIKSDEHRLPTYHLAHVVDDYLMRTTLVLRGDEWLPSTPLHMDICIALGIKPFKYAHIAPISITDKTNGGKRKLSKRKDDEADVQFWLESGYPVEGIKAYLLGLTNSNFEDWYRDNPSKPISEYPFSMEKLAASRAPLLDMTKLENYCKDYIARLNIEDFRREIWQKYDQNSEFIKAMEVHQSDGYLKDVLSIERDEPNPRKDMAKFSDAYEQYGYFFDEPFDKDFSNRITEELGEYSDEAVDTVLEKYLTDYSHSDSSDEWLKKVRAGAEATGLHMRDYTKIIRVKLTGKSRTPDLYELQQIMGENRVKSRLTT